MCPETPFSNLEPSARLRIWTRTRPNPGLGPGPVGFYDSLLRPLVYSVRLKHTYVFSLLNYDMSAYH